MGKPDPSVLHGYGLGVPRDRDRALTQLPIDGTHGRFTVAHTVQITLPDV